MKKVLLVFVGIILFILIALGGVVGAFYNKKLQPTPVAHAEEVVEEPAETEDLEVVVSEESTDASIETSTDATSELLGDTVLAFIGLKDAAYKIGISAVQKIGVGLVAICSFCEAFVIISLFKKNPNKLSKGSRGSKPQKIKSHKRKGPQVPIEGYRGTQPKDKLKF